MKRAANVLLAGVLSAGTGCTGAGTSGGAYQDVPATPAALVNEREVPWERLRPAMAELAGGQVLEEVALDQLLTSMCAERGVTVGAEEVAAERAMLVDSLDPSADRAEEILRVVRASRRLGEVRFHDALWRSAMLRALVVTDGPAEAAEFSAALRIRQGERSLVRIIVTASEADAAAARARVTPEGGVPVDPMRFATVAAEASIDESASRGGLYGEVSIADSAEPASLRRAIERTAVGGVTEVVSTGGAFAIALIEKRLPPRGELSGPEKLALAREVHLRAQRRSMERLARRLLEEARVTPMDRALRWSWEQRGK